MTEFNDLPHKVKRLLTYLSEQYEVSLNKIVEDYNETMNSELENRCRVKVHESPFGKCLLLLDQQRLCPYHKRSAYDFRRTCSFIDPLTRRRCFCSIPTKDKRNLEVTFCKNHQNYKQFTQNTQSTTMEKFTRIGNYIVIEGTLFAISDDMTSIIGYVELTQFGKIILQPEYKKGMDECVQQYGLQLDFDN